MRRTVGRLLCCIFVTAFSSAGVAQSSGDNLAEIARKYRDQHSSAAVIRQTDAKALFKEMDTILDFASKDTGYFKAAAVNRKLLSHNDLQKMIDTWYDEDKESEARLLNSELVLKKFGLLKPEFDFAKYMHEGVTNEIAGLYDNKTKTMYLMDWVPLEKQRSVMAHELTHALQDRNYDLQKFARVSAPSKKKGIDDDAKFHVGTENDSERRIARQAVIEGQAMVVLIDYQIGEYTEGEGVSKDRYRMLMDYVQNNLLNYDTRFTFKGAPRILSDTLRFPYREGLAFELEVLRSDRRAAFAGMFERPPRSSHEVLEPGAYLKHENPAVVMIPDLTSVLGDAYAPYDSGVMGEFDVYVMAREFGRENDVYSVAQRWKGGSYIVARKKSADKPTVADLALLYVSRWRTPEAALRFAEIYRAGLLRHVSTTEEVPYDTKCSLGDDDCRGMQWGTRLTTNEGLASLEIWPGNTVIISQSFEDETLSKLRRAVLARQAVQTNRVEQKELSMKLLDIPQFAALQEMYAHRVMEDILKHLQ